MRNGTVMLKRRQREEGREAKTDEELWSPGLTPVCVWGGFPRVKTAPQLRLE